MATACELAKVNAPAGSDSISFLPTLTGKGTQARHEYLYWEFYEGGSMQAVRMGKWKGIRKPMFTAPVELYDLSRDPGEKYNVARGYRDVVKEIEAIMRRAHVPHPNWKMAKSGAPAQRWTLVRRAGCAMPRWRRCSGLGSGPAILATHSFWMGQVQRADHWRKPEVRE